MSKKKHTEAPPVDPAALKNDGTPEGGNNETCPVTEIAPALNPELMGEDPPASETPKRTRAPYVKRTRAQIAEDAEKARIAKLDPVEAMEEELKALDLKIDMARVNQELANTTVRELVSQREQYVARKKAEIDEIVIRAAKALKLE